MIPPDAITVIPPERNLIRAREVGIARANWAFDNKLKNHGLDLSPSEQMANHIRGARTERAGEQYTGLPWHEQIGVLGGPDLGDNGQVRSRPYPPGGGLAFRPGLRNGRQLDKDDDAFILAWDCGTNKFILLGWLWGGELRDWGVANGKQKEPWFYVPAPYRTMPSMLPLINRRRVARNKTTPRTASERDFGWDQQTPGAEFWR